MKKVLIVVGLLIAGAILWANYRPTVVRSIHGIARSINK
jgi:hypothetical protein